MLLKNEKELESQKKEHPFSVYILRRILSPILVFDYLV